MKKTLFITRSTSTNEVECRDASGTIVLILDACDLANLAAADLDYQVDADLFEYANHLLGGKFDAFVMGFDSEIAKVA